jgi:hypothetical protein
MGPVENSLSLFGEFSTKSATAMGPKMVIMVTATSVAPGTSLARKS